MELISNEIARNNRTEVEIDGTKCPSMYIGETSRNLKVDYKIT